MRQKDYSKLRGRIVEYFGTQGAFAEAVGTTVNTMSYKLRGSRVISVKDIEQWCEILEIPTKDIGLYFFTYKV